MQKLLQYKNRLYVFGVIFLFLSLTLIYLFPLTQGLLLLPLDMLVSNYNPWYMPGQILVKNPYMQDSIIQLYPWKHMVFQSFRHGIMPFWNPYQFMGMPFLASMKPMVFYPLNILFLLGETTGWNALLFFQIVLSMIFMYLLAQSFALRILPSILASFVFSLNTLMIGVLEFGSDGHVLLWLPVFIFCAKQYLEKQKSIYLFILGIAISISIFAGQLQYTGYALVLLISFIIYYGLYLHTKLSVYMFLSLSILLGFGISAVQLFPAIELFAHSYRGIAHSYSVFAGGLNKPYQVFRLFSPDFFGNPVSRDVTIGYIESIGYFGIIPLFFSIYAMIFLWKNIMVRFFTITFIIALLLSIQNIGQILYVLHIPLLTSGEGDRVFSLAYPSAALLSGFGLTEFLQTKKVKRDILILSLFTLLYCIAILCWILFTRNSPSGVKAFLHNVQFSSIILGVFLIVTSVFIFLKRKIAFASILFILLVIGLTYFDLFRLGYRFLTFSNRKFLYPDMPITKYIINISKANLARNIGLTEPELATYLNVYTIETYNPLYIQRNAQMLDALQGKSPQTLPMNKYFVTKGDTLKYALDFLGVSNIITDKDSNPSINFFNSSKYQNSFILQYKDERYAVYKNISAYPRFGLYYTNEIVKNDNTILSRMQNRSFDFRKKVILEEKLPILLQKGNGSVKLLSSNSNSQQFSVYTTKPALFYISDTYFPGWKAIVNNNVTKIYRANYNFRAVLVPAGKSILTFSYLPSNFYLSIWISLVSLLILTILFVWYKIIYRCIFRS